VEILWIMAFWLLGMDMTLTAISTTGLLKTRGARVGDYQGTFTYKGIYHHQVVSVEYCCNRRTLSQETSRQAQDPLQAAIITRIQEGMVRKGATQRSLKNSSMVRILDAFAYQNVKRIPIALSLLPVGMPQVAFSYRIFWLRCVWLNVPKWSHVQEGLYVHNTKLIPHTVCTSELFIISFGKVS